MRFLSTVVIFDISDVTSATSVCYRLRTEKKEEEIEEKREKTKIKTRQTLTFITMALIAKKI